ncbi:MAG: hypothetical protein IVW36_06560 [Dehalococcoidia bacterium]|nr:hypothetical protein [Dehalococcoidia bacterium]
MTRWIFGLVAFVAAGFVVTACGSSGATTTSRTVPARTASTADKPLVAKAHTGDLARDQVIDTALAPNSIEMARLTGYQKIACAKQADADHPACRADEPAGTKVEVLPKLGCDAPGFVRPEDLPPVYAAALGNKNPTLSAVYEPAAGVDAFGAQAIAVLGTGKYDSGASRAVALHLKDGRITGIEDDCGDALKLLASSRVASWILRPGASAAETPTAAASPTSATAAP